MKWLFCAPLLAVLGDIGAVAWSIGDDLNNVQARQIPGPAITVPPQCSAICQPALAGAQVSTVYVVCIQ